MEESTFPVVCLAKLRLTCVTMFRALLSFTGFVWLITQQPAETLCLPGITPLNICLHVQSFLIMWSISISNYTQQSSRHQRPTGVEYPLRYATASTKMQNRDLWECSASSTFSEVAMLDHDLRSQMKWRIPSPSRHNSEQHVKKSEHKVVSAIVADHTPRFSPETAHDFLLKGLSPSLCSLSRK